MKNVFIFAIFSFGCVSQKGIFANYLDKIRRNHIFCCVEGKKKRPEKEAKIMSVNLRKY